LQINPGYNLVFQELMPLHDLMNECEMFFLRDTLNENFKDFKTFYNKANQDIDAILKEDQPAAPK